MCTTRQLQQQYKRTTASEAILTSFLHPRSMPCGSRPVERPLFPAAVPALQVLAMCFHLLSTKQPATIVNTAAAIVRQAIALVFAHAASSDATPPPSPAASFRINTPLESAAHTDTSRAPSSRDPWDPETLAATGSGAAPPAPPPEAALMLLKELCRMCRGHDSELLGCKPLSQMFLLDAICEILRSNVSLFRRRPSFLAALREDVCGTLLLILKQQLEVDTEQVQVCGTTCSRSVLCCCFSALWCRTPSSRCSLSRTQSRCWCVAQLASALFSAGVAVRCGVSSELVPWPIPACYWQRAVLSRDCVAVLSAAWQ